MSSHRLFKPKKTRKKLSNEVDFFSNFDKNSRFSNFTLKFCKFCLFYFMNFKKPIKIKKIFFVKIQKQSHSCKSSSTEREFVRFFKFHFNLQILTFLYPFLRQGLFVHICDSKFGVALWMSPVMRLRSYSFVYVTLPLGTSFGWIVSSLKKIKTVPMSQFWCFFLKNQNFDIFHFMFFCKFIYSENAILKKWKNIKKLNLFVKNYQIPSKYNHFQTFFNLISLSCTKAYPSSARNLIRYPAATPLLIRTPSF